MAGKGRIMEDMTGKKFGMLTVLHRTDDYISSKGLKTIQWLCQCECGEHRISSTHNLKNGRIYCCNYWNHFLFEGMIGSKFGKLTVIRRVENRISPHGKINSNWECLCECGNTTFVVGISLRSGRTTSCGCYRNERVAESQTLPLYQASMNILFDKYKKSAKKRKIIFDLPRELFFETTQKNCYYCGVEPLQKIDRIRCNGAYVYNGIDRVDSKRGYEIGNIVPCCGMCNYAKHSMSQQEFFDWLKCAYTHSIQPMIEI